MLFSRKDSKTIGLFLAVLLAFSGCSRVNSKTERGNSSTIERRVEDAQARCAVISGESFLFLAKNSLYRLDLPGLPDCGEVALLKKNENLWTLTSLGDGQAAFLEYHNIFWWDGEEAKPVPVDTGPITPHLAAWEKKLYYVSNREGTGLVLSLDLLTGETEELDRRYGRKWNVSNLAASGEGVFVYCLKDDVDFYDFAAEKWLEN